MIRHGAFLDEIRAYVEAHPDAAAYVGDFVAEGLRRALDAANQRASDMEIVAAMLAQPKFGKEARRLVLAKLRDWDGKTALNWDWYTKDQP